MDSVKTAELSTGQKKTNEITDVHFINQHFYTSKHLNVSSIQIQVQSFTNTSHPPLEVISP